MPYPAIMFPEIVFSMDDLARAQDRARELAAMYEVERTSRREAFEAAQKRATRRANDAELKLIEAGQEYAMKIKVEKAVIAKDFATMKEERDVATHENANLIQRLATCEQELQALKEASSSSADAELRGQLATQESQLALYDQLRASLASEAQKPREMSNRLKHESNEHNIQQSLLTSSINKLNDDFEDLSNKAIGKYAREIKQRNEDLVKQRSSELEALENTMNALESMLAPFSEKGSAASQDAKIDAPAGSDSDAAKVAELEKASDR